MIELKDKYETQMKKGVLDMIVLKLLSKEEMYGYQLISELKLKSGERFFLKEGTLYPILYRLEDDGLVKSFWKQTEGKGVPRKYYEITSEGQDTLKEITQLWREICDSTAKIMEVSVMKEKYIKTIIKNLTCSKKKKEEIKRQLESDIGEALNTGEKVEDVISRMGEADEITKAFNQSFSEEEKKQFRKERRNRRFLQITGVLAVLILLFWWTVPKNTLLTESKLFDAEEVEKKTELIIQYLDEENYQEIKKLSIEKLADMMNKKEMDQVKSHLGNDWGEFQHFGEVYLIESSRMGQHSAIAQINASYENTSVTYTLSFNQDMELNGLWIK